MAKGNQDDEGAAGRDFIDICHKLELEIRSNKADNEKEWAVLKARINMVIFVFGSGILITVLDILRRWIQKTP